MKGLFKFSLSIYVSNNFICNDLVGQVFATFFFIESCMMCIRGSYDINSLLKLRTNH